MRSILRALVLALLSLLPLATACTDATAPRAVFRVVITASGTSLAPGATLQLFAQTLDVKDKNIAGREVEWSTLDPQVASISATGLLTALSPGLARIRARHGTVEAAFTVTVAYPSCAGTTAAALLTVGQAHGGDLAAADCAYSWQNQPADAWRFSISSTTTLRFEASTTGPMLELELTTESMVFLGGGYSSPEGRPARMVVTLQPGEYRLWILGVSQNVGAYSLSGTTVTRCDAASASGSLAVGASVGGALASSSCILPNDFEGQGWSFSHTESGVGARLTVTASGFTPWIAVTDADLELLAIGYPTTGTAAVFDGFLPAGNYFAWVTSVEGGYGAFTLTREVSSLTFCGSPTDTIAVGQSLAGAIAISDCRTVRGTAGDPWSLTIGAATTVQIDMVSGNVDSYLYLFDAGGTLVASDDDSGGDLNSRIIRLLAPGTYTIHATTFSPGEIGPYTLSVQAVAGLTAGLSAGDQSSGKRPAPGVGWEREPRVIRPER